MGSSPPGRATLHPEQCFAISPSTKPSEKANAHPLQQAIESLLLAKQVDGCTSATLVAAVLHCDGTGDHSAGRANLLPRSSIAECQSPAPGFHTFRTLFHWYVETDVLRILALADSRLRANETPHLLHEDWRPSDRALFVRARKGRKDRVVFIGPTTTCASEPG